MRPTANKRAAAAASRLKTETGATYTICIAADVSSASPTENHIAIASTCDNAQTLAAILSAVVKKIGQSQQGRRAINMRGGA